MGSERASIFGDDDLDVSGFTPKKPQDKPAVRPEQVRAVSEAANFRSREPAAGAPAISATPESLPPPPYPKREPRRHRTGRNVQLNIKARAETIEEFYAIADQQGWVLGEAFEEAVAALKRALGSQK